MPPRRSPGDGKAADTGSRTTAITVTIPGPAPVLPLPSRAAATVFADGCRLVYMRPAQGRPIVRPGVMAELGARRPWGLHLNGWTRSGRSVTGTSCQTSKPVSGRQDERSLSSSARSRARPDGVRLDAIPPAGWRRCAMGASAPGALAGKRCELAAPCPWRLRPKGSIRSRRSVTSSCGRARRRAPGTVGGDG